MSFHIKNMRFLLALFSMVVALSFTSCDLDDLDDPNNPSAGAIEANATLAEIQNVVDGTVAAMRNNLPTYFDAVGPIGREYWRFSGSDPRYTNDLLGANTAQLDPGGFYTTTPYGSRYRTIRNCYILDNAIANTRAAVTPGQRKAALGFSKTIRAHELLLAFNQQWTNGIRVDVQDPANLGPFLSKDASLDAIQRLLTEANADLSAAGSEAFPFKLREGFAGFDTPANFNKFNRGLAARVAAYREKWDECLSALGASFLNPAGNFAAGCYWTYSQSGGDVLNELFQSPTATGEVRAVHPSFIADAEAGDARLAKAFKRADVLTQSGLESSYGLNVYATNTSFIPIIRNEELVLLSAEANAQKGGANLAAAVTAINAVRTQHGLPIFASNDQAAIITEMLKQRRYSLFAEGHRWVDMRRYNRLNQLPIDRPGDDVWDKFPRPTNE
jgi:starch-binding outer membrane protein, SusD/RagB family